MVSEYDTATIITGTVAVGTLAKFDCQGTVVIGLIDSCIWGMYFVNIQQANGQSDFVRVGMTLSGATTVSFDSVKSFRLQ